VYRAVQIIFTVIIEHIFSKHGIYYYGPKFIIINSTFVIDMDTFIIWTLNLVLLVSVLKILETMQFSGVAFPNIDLHVALQKFLCLSKQQSPLFRTKSLTLRSVRSKVALFTGYVNVNERTKH